MQKKLVFYPKNCTGCRYCEIACTTKHHGVCGREGSRLRLVSNDKEMTHQALFCRHCQRPVCVELCPVGAIVKDEATGQVRILVTECIGCGLCTACPLGAMFMNTRSGLAANCDLCGGEPACAQFCAFGALQYVSAEKQRGLVAPEEVR